MPSSDLLLAAQRRDADTSPVSDGATHPLYSNAIGRLKVSTLPGASAAFTGTVTTATSVVGSVDVSRASNVVVWISGTFTGVNVAFESSADGTLWSACQGVKLDGTGVPLIATGVLASPGANLAHAYELSVNGANFFRVRATAWATGTANVSVVNAVFATEPVVAVPSHPVTLTATTLTNVVPGTAAAALGKTEDAAHTSGDVGVMMLGVRNDNAAVNTTSANVDYGALSLDDRGALFTRDEPTTTPTITRVATSTTSASLLAALASRRSALIFNESAAVMYLKLGATASATSYTVQIPANQYYEVPAFYTGAIDAILASGTGNAQITSLV